MLNTRATGVPPARSLFLALALLIGLGVAPWPIHTPVLKAQTQPGKHVLLLYSHESAVYTQFEAPLRSALSARAEPCTANSALFAVMT